MTECKNQGFEVLGGPDHDDKELDIYNPGFTKEDAEEVDAVLVGMDTSMNMYKLTFALACLKNGAKFYACNPDAYDKVGDRNIPGAGCMVTQLEAASGVTPLVLGKPNKYAIETAIQEHNLSKEESIMIGDRIDTDILLGQNADVDTCLVLTGVSKLEHYAQQKKLKNGIVPTYVAKEVSCESTLKK